MEYVLGDEITGGLQWETPMEGDGTRMVNGETRTLTAAEAEVMDVVWERVPAAVGDIVENLPRPLAYTTVMTTVRILEAKGFIKKCGKRGRAYLYKAVVDRDEVCSSMFRELARRLFDGSVKTLVLNLVQRAEITSKDLAEVKQMIERLESEE